MATKRRVAKNRSTMPANYKLELAKELLDDIEMSRLPTQSLLQKALRLARITNAERIQKFLEYEIFGYPGDDDALEIASKLGRVTDREAKLGFWGPLTAISDEIDAARVQLQQLRIPDVTWAPHTKNEYDHVGRSMFGQDPVTAAIGNVINQQNGLRQTIATYSGIISKVIGSVHRWVANLYHELLFSAQQETIFEKQKSKIDVLLADRCGDALAKIPSVYQRLEEGNREAVSQALLTCRRILDSVVDSIQPQSDQPVKLEGEVVEVTDQHTKNRYKIYLRDHCASDSRREGLRQRMTRLYDRTGAGVHDDVTPEEARFIFLETYLFVGEVLALPLLPPPLAQPAQLQASAAS